MRRVVGSVVSAKSKVGVPNVVVVAYHLYDKGMSLRDPRPTDEHLEALGRRLGSAATDQRGGFEIPLDYLEALEHSSDTPTSDEDDRNDARVVAQVNLKIAVFSSDSGDCLSNDDRRALASSSTRPGVVSEQEAFVLLVDDNLVPRATAPSVDLADHVTAAYNRNTSTSEKLGAHLKQIKADALVRMTTAREKVSKLSAVPLEQRTGDRHIAYGKKELAAKLPDLQKSSLRQGCAKFLAIATSANPPSRVMRLILDEDQVKALGLAVDKKDGGLTGAITPGTFSGVLHEAIGGASLTRVARVDLDELSRLEARYLTERSGNTNPKKRKSPSKTPGPKKAKKAGTAASGRSAAKEVTSAKRATRASRAAPAKAARKPA